MLKNITKHIKNNRMFSWTVSKDVRNRKINWTDSTDTKNTMFKNISKLSTKKHIYNHPELQYLNLINDIIKNGVEDKSRNGITKSIIGSTMRFPLNYNQIPILTTKKMAWKTCLKELLWFISGNTDNKVLKDQGVHIWDDNATREFLDSRNLKHYREDDLGPIYGYQWRNYNKPYTPLHVLQNKNKSFMNTESIDQLNYIIKHLKDPELRNSRRLIMTAWNPEQLDLMALPPCHVMSQFNVLNNKLYCSLYQRSGDVGLGIPFNIASYSFLTILLAKHCDLEPGEFVHFISNAHIYKEHEESLKKQVRRQPREFPTCIINNKYKSIDDYKINDFSVNNYIYHSKINMKMKV